MSRTLHARRHAHRWVFSHKDVRYVRGDRVLTTWLRCEHAGCYARKQDLRKA